MSIEASIIIPVYNNAEEITITLERILEQDFQREKYEVIVVDNGSIDDTARTVGQFKDIILIQEEQYRCSPYSARNRGIEIAKGKVIVLLDSTCRPDKKWLSEGIKALYAEQADLVAGDVQFDYEGKVTAGKVYDALTNIKMKESVLEKKVAKTANLFIRNKLFTEIGLFPEGIRSGADIRWTARAVRSGYRLVYCEHAAVRKIARPFCELIKKQWRVGLAQPAIRMEIERSVSSVRGNLLPFSGMLKVFRKCMQNKHDKYVFRLIIISFIVWFTMALANVTGLVKYRLIDRKPGFSGRDSSR